MSQPQVYLSSLQPSTPLKPARAMQRAIEAIAAKYGLDLAVNESHLRLEQDSYEPLVIEKVGKCHVSVAHYYTQNGDLIADPDVVFWIGQGGLWYPYQFSQMPLSPTQPYTRTYVEFDDQGQPVRFNRYWQHDLAEFCTTWAQNIVDQRWLENGVQS